MLSPRVTGIRAQGLANGDRRAKRIDRTPETPWIKSVDAKDAK